MEPPGEGWRRLREGREGDWKSCERVTPSNMCWGAMLEGCCIEGVSVRETGELELFESPDVGLGGARPLRLFGWLGVGSGSSEWWMGWPLASKIDFAVRRQPKSHGVARLARTYLSLLTLSRCLDSVATLDHIGLEAYRPCGTMELEEEAAGVAEHRAKLISAPKRCRRGSAVLTYRLEIAIFMISKGCHC